MRVQMLVPSLLCLLLVVAGCGGGAGMDEEQAHDELMKLWSQGHSLVQAKKYREAEAMYRQAITHADRYESLKVFRPTCLRHLGALAVEEEDFPRALEHVRQARAAFQAAGNATEASNMDSWIQELEAKVGR